MIDAKLHFEQDPIRIADALSKGLRRKAIRISMNKAAGQVKAAVVGQAPQRYGYLKKAQRIRLKDYQEGAVWVAVVGPKNDFVKTKGKRTRGPHKGDPIKHRPSKYAHLLVHGTNKVKPNTYLQSALDSTREGFFETLTSSLKEQVAKLLPN